MFTLAEELFLLADDRVTGRPLIDHAHLDLGLGGALLLDLALSQRVALSDFHVAVVGLAATGEPLLDKALSAIRIEGRAHEPDYWVRHLAKDVYHDVRDRLVSEGHLRLDDHKVFGLFPVHQTPQANDNVERGLTERLYDAVVVGHPPTPRTAALAALVSSVGLERHLFPRCDQRSIGRRMAELTSAQWVVEAVAQTVRATDAALGILPFDDSTE